MDIVTDGGPTQRVRFLRTPFDRVNESAALRLLRSREPAGPFRYVVTPNVDHVVRLRQDASVSALYDAAWLSVCDSRPLTLLARLVRVDLPHLTGSGLTESIFKRGLEPGDRVALIAASEDIALDVQRAFPVVDVRWMVPPPETESYPAAMQACVEFIATSKADFVFVAIGSPVSERIAFAASKDPRSRGTGLCVGAALEFLVGRKRRAPVWMRFLGMEWLHRLGAEPRRLWRRYVFRILPLARLFLEEVWSHAAARPHVVLSRTGDKSV